MAEKEPGAMDKAKGLIKEATGKLTGNESMEAEGRAERGQDSSEGGSEGGNKEYFKNLIEETNKRSTGS